jgi:hypothetical protein
LAAFLFGARGFAAPFARFCAFPRAVVRFVDDRTAVERLPAAFLEERFANPSPLEYLPSSDTTLARDRARTETFAIFPLGLARLVS